jgi:AcrR family transcriptional regulator
MSIALDGAPSGEASRPASTAPGTKLDGRDPTVMTAPPRRADGAPAKIDGRSLRTERTRQRIIEAYLTLLPRGPDPMAGDIAEHAGCSVRSVFERFHDLMALRVAAADHALADAGATLPVIEDVTDRQHCLRDHVVAFAGFCERVAPLWRILLTHQAGSDALRQHVLAIRACALARLELACAVELATLTPECRRQTLLAAEAIIDIDRWSVMRDFHGLSSEEAREVWLMALDRLLPRTASEGWVSPP